MKFSCATQELLQALHLVSRAIGGQQALPILGNILMEVQGETCTVSATDLELSIVTSFAATVEREGKITIPAKAILNFAQYNPDAEVTLETNEGTKVRCISKHAKTVIAGEAASEYPTIASIEKQTGFSLEATSLLRALHLVTFASAKTSLRPVLSGVYVRSSGENLIFVATDSYRLSEYTIPAAGIGGEVTCIIPVKILEEVKVILSGQKSEKKGKEKEGEKPAGADIFSVHVTLSKQQVEMQVGQTRLLSRLIDGKFPNYEQIIPKDSSINVQFSVRELSTAVKRMHYFAKEMNNNLTFHSKDGQTTITTPQTQIGQDEAVLQTEMTGGEGKIALSSSYLLDYLNHIDAQSVQMKMSDSTHPAIFVLPEEKQCLHLIMPLRMQE